MLVGVLALKYASDHALRLLNSHTSERYVSGVAPIFDLFNVLLCKHRIFFLSAKDMKMLKKPMPDLIFTTIIFQQKSELF